MIVLLFFDIEGYGQKERHMILFTVKAWDGPAFYEVYGTDSNMLSKVTENCFETKGQLITEIKINISQEEIKRLEKSSRAICILILNQDDRFKKNVV